jgi:hypothetical protein
MAHGAELADAERLASLPYALLQEENGAFRVYLDQYAYDEQGPEEHNESHKRHDAVEAPLEEEPYIVLIALHVA